MTAYFSTYEADQAPLTDIWHSHCRISNEMEIMIRRYDTTITYAPLYIHSFRLVQPHFLLDAEKYNITNINISEIDSTADKLRHYRYLNGLLQKDVAAHVGINRGTYVSYEESIRDFYPLNNMEKIADLFNISVTDILDEYNTFLYLGQGKQIKSIRKSKMMTQSQYAKFLNVPLGTLKNWETDRVRMYKGTWKKLFAQYGYFAEKKGKAQKTALPLTTNI